MIMSTRIATGSPLSALGVVIGLVITMLAMSASPAHAVVDCTADPTALAGDADQDGFRDLDECLGITLVGGQSVASCRPASGLPAPPRETCMDPDTKDMFVILAPAAANSLLPQGFNPFAFQGGFSPVGVTVHVIPPAQATVERVVIATSAVPGATLQKAARVAESLDTSSTILGLCNWGTPNELDGCVVYTKRIKNFIDTNCFGDPVATRDGYINQYITHTFLHEVGHSAGGLAADYNSRYGGYHYVAGSGYIMQQSETYRSTKQGVCTFNISLPPNGWNTTLDPAGVNLLQ